MQRLVRALQTAIGIHQTIFLPIKLIDDNIRTVQGLVAKYEFPESDGEEGIYIVILDQGKGMRSD